MQNKTKTLLRVAGLALGAALLLPACSDGVSGLKLSELSNPKNEQKILEMSPEDRQLLEGYMLRKAMDKTIDFNVKVGQAIKEQREYKKSQQGQ